MGVGRLGVVDTVIFGEARARVAVEFESLERLRLGSSTDPLTKDEVVMHGDGGGVTRGWLFWSCLASVSRKCLNLDAYGRGRSDWGSHGRDIMGRDRTERTELGTSQR